MRIKTARRDLSCECIKQLVIPSNQLFAQNITESQFMEEND